MKIRVGAIYARVSTQKQKEGQTIQSQIEQLTQLAKEKGFEIAEELIFADEGYSGTTLARPQLDRLRELVRDGTIDVVLVYDPDRLARKYALHVLVEHEFRNAGTRIVYFKGPSEQVNPLGKMMAHMQGVFAEYEREQILDRTRRGRLYQARQGNVNMLTSAPYGFCNKRGPEFYTIEKSESRVVIEIFRLFVHEKLPLQGIVERLAKEGIKSPKGNSIWHGSTIRGILKNAAYTGVAHFGKSEKYEATDEGRIVRYKSRGKVRRPIRPTRFRAQELWQPISVTGFIAVSDYETAQELLRQNKELAARNTKEPSILQGLVICGVCGCTFYKKKRQDGQKVTVHYYCRSQLVSHIKSCSNRFVRQEDLDKLVWDNIVELLKNPDLIEKEIDRRATEKANNKSFDIKRKELQNALRLVQKASDKLLDAYQVGDCLTIDNLRQRMKTLKQQEIALKKDLETIDALTIQRDHQTQIKYTMESFKNRLEGSFTTLTTTEKQSVVRALIEDIVVFPDYVEIRHAISTNCPLSCASPSSP